MGIYDLDQGGVMDVPHAESSFFVDGDKGFIERTPFDLVFGREMIFGFEGDGKIFDFGEMWKIKMLQNSVRKELHICPLHLIYIWFFVQSLPRIFIRKFRQFPPQIPQFRPYSCPNHHIHVPTDISLQEKIICPPLPEKPSWVKPRQ